jgi:1-deoxy-D-xylulose-5-phosphate synthase
MLWTMLHHNTGPIAIRYPRGIGTGAVPKAQPKILEIGKAEIIKHGDSQPVRVALFGLGGMCQMASQAAAQLEAQGISATVINPRWIKPLDTQVIEFFARSVDVICTLEDHVLHNGFGAGIMEHLAEQHINARVVRIGWPDQFIEHGAVDILRQKHGLTAEAAVQKVLAVLPQKKSQSVA